MLGFDPDQLPKKKARKKKSAAKNQQNSAANLDAENTAIAGGGLIQGPGTGTSDDIQTQMPAGSYVMPADSTAQIGEEALAGLGSPASVRVSNGEYQLPPEQVHAVGVQALDQMRDQTHIPTGQPQVQGSAERPEQFFADGGLVEDPRRISRSRALVPAQQPTQQAAPASSPSRALVPSAAPQPQGRPDFYTNTRGETARGYAPSASRAVVPAGPVTMDPSRGLPRPGPEGIDERTMERLKRKRQRDAENFRRSEQAAQEARTTQPPKPKASSAGSRARGFLKNPWVSRLAVPLAAGTAVNDARDEDSTARYAQRFGMSEPTGDGSLADIGKFAALRGLGFASDMGAYLDPTGLVRRSYRDTEPTETGPLEQAGTGAGAVAGFSSGGRRMVGKGLDKTAQAVTRGRYKGNVAERVLAPKGKKADLAAGVVGAAGGSQALGAAGGVADDALGLSQQAVPAAVTDAEQQPGAVTQPNDLANTDNPDPVTEFVERTDQERRDFARSNIVDGVPMLDSRMANTIDPNSINTISSKGMMGLGSQSSQAVSQALKAAADRGDWDAVNRHYRSQGQSFAGMGAPGQGQGTRVFGIRDQTRAPSNAEIIHQRLESARMRNADAARRTDIEGQRVAAGIDSDQFRNYISGREQDLAERQSELTIAQQQRLQALYDEFDAADDAGKARIAQRIAFLSGDKGQNQNLSQNFMKVKRPVFDERGNMIGEQEELVDLRQFGQQAALPPLAENPQVQLILNNTQLSKEERARRIRALGYE